jgi:hypothetical protein
MNVPCQGGDAFAKGDYERANKLMDEVWFLTVVTKKKSVYKSCFCLHWQHDQHLRYK